MGITAFFCISFVIYILIIRKIIRSSKSCLKEFEMETKNRPENVHIDESIVSLFHTKGKHYMEHLGKTKMRYKNLAILCLTAIFLAFAYMVASNETFDHINKIYFICFITLLTVIAINLIRFLDIYISHEQLRLLFKIELKMEKRNKNIVKPYTKMGKFLYGKKIDPMIIDFFFYGSIIFGITAISSIIIIAQISSLKYNLAIFISLFLLGLCLVWEVLEFF